MSTRKAFTRVLLFGSVASGGLASMCYVNPEQFDSQLFYLYRKLPLKALSTIVGKMMSLEISENRRESIIGKFSRTVGADLTEAKNSDLKSYSTLNEFFTRELKEGARTFEKSSIPHQVWCPSDGKILQFGVIGESCPDSANCKEQVSTDVVVKGQSFSLSQFLGPIQLTEEERTSPENRSASEMISYSARDLLALSYHRKKDKRRGESDNRKGVFSKSGTKDDDTCLYACVIYLSPKDCHRFYSPVKWTINYVRHFSGSLLSVRPGVLKFFSRSAAITNSKKNNHHSIPHYERPNQSTQGTRDYTLPSSPIDGGSDDLSSVLSVQERCVMMGEWEHGFFSFTAVGATAVGSITINCCPEMQTNNRTRNGLFQDFKLSSETSSSSDRKSMSNRCDRGVKLSVGDEVGRFNLGSTIVLVFEAPKGLQLATSSDIKSQKTNLPSIDLTSQRGGVNGTGNEEKEMLKRTEIDVDNGRKCKIGQCLFV